MPWGSKELALVRQQIVELRSVIAHTKQELDRLRGAGEDTTNIDRDLISATSNMKNLKARRAVLLRRRSNYRART